MKKIILLLILFIVNTTYSQTENNKYIEVIGSHSLSIIPDEIYLTIRIKEYWLEEYDNNAKVKNFKTKIDLDKIEEEFYRQILLLDINKSKITVESINSYNKTLKKDIILNKTFKIKFSDINEVENTINALDFKGLENISISDYSHSKITEYRKQVKIEALNQAKIKATYLLNSIDKKIGEPLMIEEIDNQSSRYLANSNSNSVSLTNLSENSNSKKIIIRYEFKVRFQII